MIFSNMTNRFSVISTICCTLLIFLSGSSIAEVSGPGWFVGTADPVTHEQSVQYLSKRAIQQKSIQSESKEATTDSKGEFQTKSATTATSLITELAYGLQNDPKLIFDYVHNHIDYIPYFGSLKGATLTLLDGSGNDCDQAALMIALLREAGYTAQFVYGEMTVPMEELSNWLGVANDPNIAGNVLYSGGIPTHGGYANVFDRIWVKANIDGTDYLFDPAWKSYTDTAGIDIETAMNYDRASLLAEAENGADVTSTSTQDLNESGIGVTFSTYSDNLVSTIQSQYPNATVDQILGGRSIVQSNLTTYQTSLPFTSSPAEEIIWDEVPDSYTATLRIQHEGIDTDDVIENKLIPNLAGKRLTLTYDDEDDNRPKLLLDGELIASGNATTHGDSYAMTITIDHPYVNGMYGQTSTFHLESGATYAIVSGFEGANNGLIAMRQKKLDQAITDGESDTSEPVLGETLNIMGQTWIKEVMMSGKILDKLSDTITVRHHTVGVMAQEDRYYIDIPMAYSNKPIPRHGNTGVEDPRFYANGLLGSSFEHGILEQLQNNPSASTIKLLRNANDEDRVVNWFTDPDDSDCTQMKPAGADLTVGTWSGMGFIKTCEYPDGRSSIGMIISALSGGAGGNVGNVDVPQATNTTQNITQSISRPATIAQSGQITPLKPSPEPVDMASGTYMFDHTDLILGGNSPTGLAFHRSYFSSKRLQQLANNNGFSHGWAHNYNIRLEEGSGGDPGLGVRTPADMAPMIVAQKAILDLLQNEDNIKGWMVSSLAAKWAIDQLIDNVVTLQLGGKSMQFVKLPDGSFLSPPGITSTLSKSGDIYTLQERFDRKTVFEKVSDKNYRINYTEDADGNQVNFIYTGDKLTTVSNGFGHSLTLHYTGDRITSVSDSTSRSVSYGYTGDDLTSYTDANGKIWQYGYNSSGMRTLTNPLTTITATNTYDSLGRVKTQTVPRQSGGDVTYNFYFSGYRNVEEDPEGNQLIYHFDHKGRSIADKNQLSHKVSRKYDGQDHIVETTDQRGNSVSFEFTGHDQTKITNPLTHETILLYDAEHRLTETTDPLIHKANFGYDSEHHQTSGTVYPATGQSISTGATFYPNGQTETATDGRDITTTFTYDPQGNPATSRLTGETPVVTQYDPIGRLSNLTDRENSSTIFTYTDIGQVKTKTDPFDRVTTYNYYDDGTLHTVNDRNGDTTTYTYTPTGKVDTVTYQDTSTVHFTYDQHDRLSSMVDSMGTTTYLRDEAGRVTSVNDANGNIIAYTYDENGYTGLLTTLTYPGNKQVTYTYDELNRLKTVTNWLTQTATYNYDNAGRLFSLTNFNGTVTTYSQDNANRLTGIDSRKTDNSVIASFVYTLDDNGNRIGIDKNIPLTAPLPVRNETADYTHNRLDTTTTASYVHDNEGQLSTKTEGGTSTYTFDDAYRLTGISDGTSTSYSYDGAGNRLRAVRGGTETRYIYDAVGNLLAEADSSNTITRYYIHGAGLLAAVTPADAVYCYHFDGVGSTAAITDSSQGVVNSYAYTPFGMLLNESEAFAQPFKYVGKLGVMAEDNGFHYMRARYYEPITGRFISEDPLGFEGGDVNLYSYVQNSPVMFADPSGLIVWGGFVSGSLGTPVAVDASGGVLVEGMFNDVALTGEIAGTYGYQVTADVGAGFVVAPFADSVNDMRGDSWRLSIRWGISVDITVPKDNLMNSSIAIDLIPGIDYGVGVGEVNAGVIGGGKP